MKENNQKWFVLVAHAMYTPAHILKGKQFMVNKKYTTSDFSAKILILFGFWTKNNKKKWSEIEMLIKNRNIG